MHLTVRRSNLVVSHGAIVAQMGRSTLIISLWHSPRRRSNEPRCIRSPYIRGVWLTRHTFIAACTLWAI